MFIAGFYSDLDPRDDDNVRNEARSLQPLEEFYDDNQDPVAKFAEKNNPKSVDEEPTNKKKSVAIGIQVNISDGIMEDEEKSSTSTAQSAQTDSKSVGSYDRLESSPALSEITVKGCNPEEINGKGSEMELDAEQITGCKDVEKVRNYEKPWKSKPMPKVLEPTRKISMPAPAVMPKKNVESKLKVG